MCEKSGKGTKNILFNLLLWLDDDMKIQSYFGVVAFGLENGETWCAVVDEHQVHQAPTPNNHRGTNDKTNAEQNSKQQKSTG